MGPASTTEASPAEVADASGLTEAPLAGEDTPPASHEAIDAPSAATAPALAATLRTVRA